MACARLLIPTLLVTLNAASVLALANVTITPHSVNLLGVACDQLQVNMTIAADVTNSDEPVLSSDYFAVVAHDGTGKYVSASYSWWQTRPRDQSTSNFVTIVESQSPEGLYRSAPITVRVHDIADPRPSNSLSGINLVQFASLYPVVGEILIDPATYLPAACSGMPIRNDEIRISPGARRTTQTLPIGESPVLLSFDNLSPPASELKVAVPAPSELVVFFRARCSNDAADDGSTANIDLFVDGVELEPTGGSDDAFCSSNGVAGHDQWISARTSGGTRVTGPALHRVEVRASSPNGGATVLDDLELTVMVPEPGSWSLLTSGSLVSSRS